MTATNVEELICVLETFDAEQALSIGEVRGMRCILVGIDRIPIKLPSDLRL